MVKCLNVRHNFTLSQSLTVDGKALEEKKLLSDCLKVGDSVVFDCHVYDKGGNVGNGKDRCNYYAMRATKNSREYDTKVASAGGAAFGGQNAALNASAANAASSGAGAVSAPIIKNSVIMVRHFRSRQMDIDSQLDLVHL